MRALRLLQDMWAAAALAALLSSAAIAGPVVGFSPETMSVYAGATLRTPPVVITNATGVTQVNLTVTLPADISISTTLSGGNLACVTQGSAVTGLFFSEWNALTREISITCSVNGASAMEVVRHIQFAVGPNIGPSQMTLGGSLVGGNSSALFGSLSLAPPHLVSISSCSVSPTQIASSGTTNCSIVASDNWGHALTYSWSDGGRGGSFAPSANVQNPTYTAPVNLSGATVSIPLRCTVLCSQNASVYATGSTSIAVLTVPPKAISITSTPNSGASISYSPSPDTTGKASPRTTPVSISYLETATNIVLTAAKQDGSARPLWFDHWSIDGVDKPQGQLSVTINMNGSAHTAQAVYGRLVGDLDSDGIVGKQDAQVVLSAILGDTAKTAEMDVDGSGVVDLRDAKWILSNPS